MVTRVRLAAIGAADARRATAACAREITVARRAAGGSQADTARRAGLSRPQYGRIERNEQRRLAVEDVCRAARAVGLRCVIQFYPSELRVHDAGQLAVLERFERLLASTLRMRREVVLPRDRDLRAWDSRVTDGSGHACSVDAEARVGDIQALTRRTLLKQRDDPDAGVVILVLNRTAHNRAVLREHREALRADFPLDGTAIARHLRRGEIPPARGIILV